MREPGESYRDLDDLGYPTREEIESAWLKLIVQPALLEEVKRAQKSHTDEAARVREALRMAHFPPTGRAGVPAPGTHPPPYRTSTWSRLLRVLGTLLSRARP